MDIDAAWDSIQARSATTGHGQAGPRRRALLAVAAALLVLLGATMILNRNDDNGRVRTEDRTTTTDHTTSSMSPDVDVSWWVTTEGYERGYYTKLYDALRRWIYADFSFRNPYFSNTQIPGPRR